MLPDLIKCKRVHTQYTKHSVVDVPASQNNAHPQVCRHIEWRLQNYIIIHIIMGHHMPIATYRFLSYSKNAFRRLIFNGSLGLRFL